MTLNANDVLYTNIGGLTNINLMILVQRLLNINICIRYPDEEFSLGNELKTFRSGKQLHCTMDKEDAQPSRVIDEKFKEEMLQSLNEQRKANFKCDITIQAEGQNFAAHSNVLSAASDYFKALFASELFVKEKQNNLVELNDMKSTTVAEVLQFIYTGEANIDPHNAQDLVVASDYLIIPSLKSKATQFLTESLNASNCLALESFASKYNCDSLRQEATKYKYHHFVAVVKSQDFLSLCYEEVKELMRKDELNISEEEQVYEAAVAWVKHDLSSRECFLPDLLKCLRFFSMSKFSLRNILSKEHLVLKNPKCTTIVIKGLEFFLFPDRWHGTSLKHRTFITNKEEHVVVLNGGFTNTDYEKVSPDTFCFVLATKKWHLLRQMPDFFCSRQCLSTVCGGRLFSTRDTFKEVIYLKPERTTWRSRCTHCPTRQIYRHSYTDYTVTSFNEELYVIGGEEDDTVYKNVFKYNPVRDEWKQLASMETGRAGHCAVILEDLIYVMGGFDGDGNHHSCLKSVEYYNPSTNQWKEVPDLINARSQFAAAATTCGKILAVGGFCELGLLTEAAVVEPTCELFDPCLNQWSLVSSPKVPRAGCGIVSVDDTVYVFGGHGKERILDSMECFDTKHNEWHQVDVTLPKPLSFVQASLLKLPKKFISNST